MLVFNFVLVVVVIGVYMVDVVNKFSVDFVKIDFFIMVFLVEVIM